MTILPTDIPTGLVTGQFYFVNEDNVDSNTDPELTVIQGNVVFTASAPVLYMPTRLATIVPLEFKAVFDSNGNLVSASDPTVGLKLPATDSTLLTPTGFTWRVDFNLVQASNRHSIVIPSFNFQVPTGGTVDLTTAVPVSTSPGTLTVQGAAPVDANIAPIISQPLTAAALNATYARPSSRGAWAKLTTSNAATSYDVGDVVTFNRQRWQCTVKHAAGATFKADQAAGKWVFVGNETGNTIGLFGGALPVASRPGTFGGGLLSNGTDTSATARTVHIIRTGATDLRLAFSNISSGGVGPNAITVQAAIEPPVTGTSFSTSGTYIYPVTFNGGTSAVIQPGASIVSDPVPVTVLVGQAIYVRTAVTVTAGQKWPQGLVAGAAADELYPIYNSGFTGGTQEGVVTNSVVLNAGGNVPAGSAYGFVPSAIIGTPLSGSALPQSVALIGDSITEGSGETFPFIGYAVRACNLAGLGYVNIGVHGTLAANFLGTTLGTLALQLAAGCTLAIEEYGRNDVTNGSYTALQIETNKVNIWKELARRGIAVTTATITPRTTSTDNWKTTTNQTIADATAVEAIRVAVNTWIRAGGPIDPTTLAPVAVGTSGALLFGMPGHPCAGYSEVAWLVETAHDSGIWQGPDRTVTDAAMTSTQNTITSTTAAFTAADVGKTIWISGAGPSSAAFKGQINAVNSATQITLQYGQNASTTVSGATLNIGIKTDDGTHPNTGPHITIANAFTLAT